MSLLMFRHTEQYALILTDTLATTTAGEPLIFQSKAWAIPHLNMAVVVTGVANLGASWNDFLRSSLVARDIDTVDQFAPEHLQRLWSEFLAESSVKIDAPLCIVYHFGFREGSDQLVCYIYRSNKSFESEPCGVGGFGIKPKPAGEFDVPDEIDDWIVLAERVRAEQDAKSIEERIHIGGELFMLMIQNWQSQTIRVHRFEDYEHVWLQMNELLHR